MNPTLTLCTLDRLCGMVDVYNYIIRVVNILTFNYLHIAGSIASCSQSGFSPLSSTGHFQLGCQFLGHLQGSAFSLGAFAFLLVCTCHTVLAPFYGCYAQGKWLWQWMASCTEEFGYRLLGIAMVLVYCSLEIVGYRPPGLAVVLVYRSLEIVGYRPLELTMVLVYCSLEIVSYCPPGLTVEFVFCPLG